MLVMVMMAMAMAMAKAMETTIPIVSATAFATTPLIDDHAHSRTQRPFTCSYQHQIYVHMCICVFGCCSCVHTTH